MWARMGVQGRKRFGRGAVAILATMLCACSTSSPGTQDAWGPVAPARGPGVVRSAVGIVTEVDTAQGAGQISEIGFMTRGAAPLGVPRNPRIVH